MSEDAELDAQDDIIDVIKSHGDAFYCSGCRARRREGDDGEDDSDD